MSRSEPSIHAGCSAKDESHRRAVQIGLHPLFPNEQNSLPWMSEMIDLKKERNFLETRVTEYRSGGALSWDS